VIAGPSIFGSKKPVGANDRLGLPPLASGQSRRSRPDRQPDTGRVEALSGSVLASRERARADRSSAPGEPEAFGISGVSASPSPASPIAARNTSLKSDLSPRRSAQGVAIATPDAGLAPCGERLCGLPISGTARLVIVAPDDMRAARRERCCCQHAESKPNQRRQSGPN
jgi:hypothetical protein